MPYNYPFSVPSGETITSEVSGSSSLGTLSVPFKGVYTDNIVINGSIGLPGTINANVISGTTISGNSIFMNGVSLDAIYANISGDTFTGPVFAPVLSGTFISGNTLTLSGQLQGSNAIFSGVVDASVLSGTTISGVNAFFQNITITNPVTYTTLNANLISGTTISGQTIYENGQQVINSGVGLGNVTVTNSNGTLTISGTQYVLPSTVSFTLMNASVVSGTTISGNTLTLSGLFNGTSAIFSSTVDAATISGTTISGNSLWLSGTQFIPGNYQPIGNYVVSGSSTILNVLDVTTLSGTTVNTDTINSKNSNVSVQLNTPTVSGTTINSDTVNTKNITATTEVYSPIVSGTTINNDTLNGKTATFTVTVNTPTVSGTTVNTDTVNSKNVTASVEVYSPTVSGTTINNDTLNGKTGTFTVSVSSPTVSGTTVNSNTVNTKVLTATTEVFSPIISGTTISGDSIFESGKQVVNAFANYGTGFALYNSSSGATAYLNTISGAGSVTVSSASGLITINGVNAGTVTGPVGSVNNAIATWNGTGGTALLSTGVIITPSGTLNAPTISGTIVNTDTINAKNITATTEIYSPIVSGTTINNDTLNGKTSTFTVSVNTPTVSGTTINSDTVNTKNITASVEVYSPVVSGTTISGNNATFTNLTVNGSETLTGTLNAAVVSGTTISGNQIVLASGANSIYAPVGPLGITSNSGGFTLVANGASPTSGVISSYNMYINGANLYVGSTAISMNGYVYPAASGVSSLGLSGFNWSNVFTDKVTSAGLISAPIMSGTTISGNTVNAAVHTSQGTTVLSGNAITITATTDVINLDGSLLPTTANYLLGNTASPFSGASIGIISGTTIFQNGTQVVSSVNALSGPTLTVAGAGAVVVSNAGSTITISGTSAGSNAIISGSSTILNVLDVNVLSGTTISGGSFVLGSGPDLSLLPIQNNQTAITSWWTLQLVGNKQSSVNYTPVNVGAKNVSSVIVPNQQAGSVGLIVQNIASQTADSQQWTNSASGAMARVDVNGSIMTPLISGTTHSGNTYSVGTAVTAQSSGTVNIGSLAIPISGVYANTFIGDVTRLNFVIDGGGSVISSGSAGFVEVPYNASVLQWDFLGNVSGTISCDVRRSTYTAWSGAGFATTITTGSKPTISGVNYKNQTVSPAWSGINANDILEFYVDALPLNITRATLSLKLQKLS